SEVANFNAQYSLTALLYALGVASDTALRAGEACYLAMLAFGLFLAARLRRSFGDAAFVVLTPPACALLGGAFVHDHQMALALPFAFVLAKNVRRPALAFAAIAALAVPWQSVFEMFLFQYFPPHLRFDPVSALRLLAAPSRLAEDVWQAWIGASGARAGRTPLEILLFKLPTWLALVGLLFAALRTRERAGTVAVRLREILAK
ncbi:MAG: hypothetical protein IAI49_11430, partial [Candidatus Eremiobacteraeota bacterium]|nr:hypothetical protein [Candidatus Eremiobacteraeota bacterium]